MNRMGNFETQSIASSSDTLEIETGKTFAFVSDLEGYLIRDQVDELAANPWWVAVYTYKQGANFGALFCAFKEEEGRVWDAEKAHMNDLIVKLVETEEERQAAYVIRIQVFVEEQGVPAEEELDEDDGAATHAIALLGGKALATGRVVYLESGEAKIGRMAVKEAWRRRGIGGRILRTLEEAAKQRSISQAVLHAQTYVKDFYAGHGYIAEGDTFLEVAIEHIQMRKTL